MRHDVPCIEPAGLLEHVLMFFNLWIAFFGLHSRGHVCMSYATSHAASPPLTLLIATHARPAPKAIT